MLFQTNKQTKCHIKNSLDYQKAFNFRPARYEDEPNYVIGRTLWVFEKKYSAIQKFGDSRFH